LHEQLQAASVEKINQTRIGQIAVVCSDIERTTAFYSRVFGWDEAFGTESFRGAGISEVQGMNNAAASARWLIDSRAGFQLEIFQYEHPQSRPLPDDSSVRDLGYNRMIIATRSLAGLAERLQALDSGLASAFAIDDADRKRALGRDPDGILLEVVESPARVPDGDDAVLLGVGVTVNDLELFNEDLVEGFGFRHTGDVFGHLEHWDLDGALEKCHTLELGDMFVVASQYRDSRPRPRDYRLGDIGIMNFALLHPSLASLKAAYLHSCGLGMRSTSVPFIVGEKAAVVYQNTREDISVEMLYVHSRLWGLFGFSRATWRDHLLDTLATWKARRAYRREPARDPD